MSLLFIVVVDMIEILDSFCDLQDDKESDRPRCNSVNDARARKKARRYFVISHSLF